MLLQRHVWEAPAAAGLAFNSDALHEIRLAHALCREDSTTGWDVVAAPIGTRLLPEAHPGHGVMLHELRALEVVVGIATDRDLAPQRDRPGVVEGKRAERAQDDSDGEEHGLHAFDILEAVGGVCGGDTAAARRQQKTHSRPRDLVASSHRGHALGSHTVAHEHVPAPSTQKGDISAAPALSEQILSFCRGAGKSNSEKRHRPVCI